MFKRDQLSKIVSDLSSEHESVRALARTDFEQLLPNLAEHAPDSYDESEMWHLVFEGVRSDGVDRRTLHAHSERIIHRLSNLRSWLASAQRNEGFQWMWEGDYNDRGNLAALLLDLASDLPASAVIVELRHWLSMADPRLLVFSALSLLRHQQDVPWGVLTECTRFPELRLAFYDHLCEIGRSDLFPQKYRSQHLFAEADMVRWLTYPTELSTVPDEIVCAQVLKWRDPSDGLVGLYVFRFRTCEPHWSAKDGWMAGIAGPFQLGQTPSTNSLGMTFSKFTMWEEMNAVEHALDIARVTSADLPAFEVVEPGAELQ